MEWTLNRGERLLWTGAPPTGVRFRSTDALEIPFSLVWAAFAFFWEWQVIADGAPPQFLLIGALFCVVGLYIVVGRFIWDARQRARTEYALTTQRAVVVRGNTITSFDLTGLSPSLEEGRTGRGTVWLTAGSPPGPFRRGGPPRPGFEGIPNGRDVFSLLTEARLQCLSGANPRLSPMRGKEEAEDS